MAQIAPPSADAPRALPRRAALPRNTRPRLVPLDGAWMLVLALAALLAPALTPHPGERWGVGAGLSAVTTVLLYLLGWRARDRATGIVAGLLLATSVPFFLHTAAVPRDALLALLTVAALFSFVAGSSLLALALAGLATAVRPDAALLGLLLMVLALAQRRRRAAWGVMAFPALAVFLTLLTHPLLPHVFSGARDGLLLWAVTPGMALVTWMLLPFCAELGEAPRRARWLPVVLWALSYFVASCFVRVSNFESTLIVLLPVWFVLAAGGVSRLLPALTGEIPMPWARYTLATFAVLSLLAMRFSAERPPRLPAAARASVAPPAPTPARPGAIAAPAAAVAASATAALALRHVTSPTLLPKTVAVRPAPKPKVAHKSVITPRTVKPKAVPARSVARLIRPVYQQHRVFRRYRPFLRRRFQFSR